MLDKKYNDEAKIILEKWNSFTGIAANYEDMNDAVEENVEEITDKMNENIEQDITSMTSDEQDELIEDTGELQKETFDQTEDFIGIAVSMELEERETDDENMREFFAQPAKNFKGNDIRKLYPMVESLSKGQIAGLDFLTMQELIDAGLNSILELENRMKELKDIPVASVYEGVNREIFEPGTVGLTNDALRQRALQAGNEPGSLTTCNIVAIGLGGLAAIIATITVSIIDSSNSYDVDFSPIPKYMVEETDITKINEKGEKEFYRNDTAYYSAVKCNRETMAGSVYCEI